MPGMLCITRRYSGITEAEMATTVTRKGQVTIPKPVRDRLGIKAGSAVVFELAPDGRVVLIKVEAGRPVSRFEALRGRAGKGLSTDEIMALTRGEN
ncbi:MAG: AbrB/MazE/SpoVT family DNA-binding domain-containing protein [Magnetospirillum sp.]|nr:AbrB/MazE/SpoVT family DNA-binding domain-containing protein [Magnetospirillum sp.]